MKKIARLMALAVLVAAMASGCQKQEADKVAANPINRTPVVPPPSGSDVDDYQALQQYLLGSWARCQDIAVVHNSGAHDGHTYDDLYQIFDTGICLTMEQIHRFNIFFPNERPFTIPPDTIQFTEDSITINGVQNPYQVLSPCKIGTPNDTGYTILLKTYEWSHDTMLIFDQLNYSYVRQLFVRYSN